MVDTHTIVIEQSPQGVEHVSGWTVAFDGTVTAIASLDGAIHLAIEMGTKAWALDHRPIKILWKDGKRTVEVGRFESCEALDKAS